MPGARRLTVVLFVTAWIVSACVSVAPPAQTGSPVTGETPPSQPPLVEPTVEPEPPTPTNPPDEPEPPEPVVRPNLRVQKFELVREPVLVGEVAALTADITNFADTAAGPFTVEFFVDQPGEDDLIFDFQTIQGLAAGGATVLNVSITPDVVGLLGLIARVDPEDEVTETDESDNETILELSVVENEINLTLPADGLTVSSALIPEEPTAYLFTIALTNTGQSTLVGPMSVRYFGRTDAGQYVEWGTFDFEIDLAPGDLFNRLVGWSVDPGTYRAYALADSGEDWPEIIEDDNQAFVDFTAP